MELYDSEGNKVDNVVTKEEHEKQLADAATLAIANAQKDGSIVPKADFEKLQADQKKLEDDLKAAKEDLEKIDDKDKNFAELRKQKEAAEAKLKEFEGGVGKKLADLEQRVGGDDIRKGIEQLSEGDAEVAKKIRFHFDRISKPDDTEDDRKQKLVDAATLAKGRVPAPSLLSGVLSGASGYSKNDMKDPDDRTSLAPELAGLAKNLGLSDKDVDKFSKKPLTK